MKHPPFLFLILILLNFACARPTYSDDTGRGPASENEFSLRTLNVQFYWDHRPVDEKDPGSFILEFFNPQDRSDLQDPVNAVTAYLWMPDMSHGAPPLQVERVSLGVYRITGLYFIMRGHWDLHIQLKRGAEVVEEFIKSELF